MPRKLEDWFTSYMHYTTDDEPPAIYKKWTAVSTIAAALQRKCFVQIGRIHFYPNFYIALVGRSAARKSTALSVEVEMLENIGIATAANVVTKEKMVIEFEKLGVASTTPPENLLERVKRDVRLALPVGSHASLTAVSSELMTFFPSNDPLFGSYLIDFFDWLPKFKYETKTQGDHYVENVWLNLVGGITPETLSVRLTDDLVGSGLVGRFIFVYSGGSTIRHAFPPDGHTQKSLRKELEDDLRQISLLNGGFTYSPEWAKLYQPWYEIEDKNNPPFTEAKLQAYSGRRPSYIIKLSQVFSAARSDDMVLTKEDFLNAKALLEETEEDMPRAIAGMGSTDQEKLFADIVNCINNHPEGIPFRLLLQQYIYKIDETGLLTLLQSLVTSRIASANRPTGSVDFIVRPGDRKRAAFVREPAVKLKLKEEES